MQHTEQQLSVMRQFELGVKQLGGVCTAEESQELDALMACGVRLTGERVRVAGVSYRQGDCAWLANNPGACICLEPEPTNPYDPNAIKVVAYGPRDDAHHVGFIPKNVTWRAHLILGSGQLGAVGLMYVRAPQSAPDILGVGICVIYQTDPNLLRELSEHIAGRQKVLAKKLDKIRRH